MKIEITIQCDNAAFGDSPEMELGRILENLAMAVKYRGSLYVGLDDIFAFDANGNKVGVLSVLE